jgi:uncharacterized membrane protein YfcA
MPVLLLVVGLAFGFILGFVGTLTGIGGGFLLLPLLVIFLPNAPLESLALASLCVVVFNSLSGTLLSLRQSRVRLRTGITFGLISLPSVWWGTQLQAMVNVRLFHLLLGALLLAGAGLLVGSGAPIPRQARAPAHVWLMGAALSVVIGFVSGFFALGGGFLFLPLLIFLLRFRVDQASATTQLIVGIGSVFALFLHLGRTDLPVAPMLLAGLIAGVLVGSPVGNAAAVRWDTRRVLFLLAALMSVAGLKFVLFP